MITYNSGTPAYDNRWLNYTEPSLPPLADSAYIVRVKTFPGMQPALGTLAFSHLFEIDKVTDNIYDVKLDKSHDYERQWSYLFMSPGYDGTKNLTIAEVLGMNTVIPYGGATGTENPYVVRNTNYMFDKCTDLRKVSCDIDLSGGGVSGMFERCYSLEELQNIKLTEVTNIDNMFYFCSALQSVNLQTDSALSGMNGAFQSAHLTALPSFNVTNVTDASFAFADCRFAESNILGMYEALANNGHITSHDGTFRNCGISSTIGQQELAQIPESWK